MPDQSGRVALITGGNSGIGFYAAQGLAGKGATVILACRNEEKAWAAVDQIRAQDPKADVTVQALELADLASVRKAAAEVNEKYDRLDLLVNNAGLMAIPYTETADGFETQMGVNHLGHFALTSLLWEKVAQTDGSRVVSVASSAHRMGDGFGDDIRAQVVGSDRLRASYSRWPQYGRSKLANLLFMRELDRRAKAAGSQVVSVAAHPGWSSTNLQGPMMDAVPTLLAPFAKGAMAVTSRTIAQDAKGGARPTLYAATQPGLTGGEYAGPGGRGEIRGAPRLVGMSGSANDPALAARLWSLSEELTGETLLS